DHLLELSSSELLEREQFVYEATIRMRDRLAYQEVWACHGISAAQAVAIAAASPDRRAYEAMLFSKIVPSCRRIGLLESPNGWLRERFAAIGALAFDRVGQPDDC